MMRAAAVLQARAAALTTTCEGQAMAVQRITPAWTGSHARDPAWLAALEARFWAKVRKSEAPDGCWEWTGGKERKGHGCFRVEGRLHRAHRVAYWLATGRWPGELDVCHHCDNPPCCRFDHFFLGTNVDNTRDMWAKGRHFSQKNPELWKALVARKAAIQRARTHCKHGHPFDKINTYITKRGHRECRACRLIGVHKWLEQNRALHNRNVHERYMRKRGRTG